MENVAFAGLLRFSLYSKIKWIEKSGVVYTSLNEYVYICEVVAKERKKKEKKFITHSSSFLLSTYSTYWCTKVKKYENNIRNIHHI